MDKRQGTLGMVGQSSGAVRGKGVVVGARAGGADKGAMASSSFVGTSAVVWVSSQGGNVGGQSSGRRAVSSGWFVALTRATHAKLTGPLSTTPTSTVATKNQRSGKAPGPRPVDESMNGRSVVSVVSVGQ